MEVIPGCDMDRRDWKNHRPIGKYVGPSQTEWSVDPYLCLSLSVINLWVKDWNNHRHNKDKSFSISIHLSNTMDVHFESVFFRIDNE